MRLRLKRTQRLLLVLGAMALCLLGLNSGPPLPAQAQPATGGLSVDLFLPAGAATTATVRLTNPGPGAQQLQIDLRDYDRDRDGSLRLLPPGSHPRSLAPYIVVSHTQLTLVPGAQTLLTLSVRLPEGASGPLWTGVLIHTPEANPTEPPSEGMAITLQVVQQLLLKVRRSDPQNAVNQGRITAADVLFADPVSEDDKAAALRISFEYENTGTTFQQPWGEVRLIDTEGRLRLTQEIPAFPMLPGGRRRLIVELTPPEPLPPGAYIALIILDFGGDYLLGAQVHFFF